MKIPLTPAARRAHITVIVAITKSSDWGFGEGVSLRVSAQTSVCDGAVSLEKFDVFIECFAKLSIAHIA